MSVFLTPRIRSTVASLIPSGEFHKQRSRSRHVWAPLILEPLEDRTLLDGASLARAVPIQFPNLAIKHGFLAVTQQQDLYALSLSAGDEITAEVDAQSIGSGLDSMLRVLNASGSPIASNDNDKGVDPQLQFEAGQTGTYYLSVSGHSDSSADPNVTVGGGNAATGSYTLKLIKHSAEPLLPDLVGASFHILQPTADWGDAVTVDFTIENRGGAAAPAFTADLRLSADNRIDDSDLLLQSLRLPELPSGSTVTRTLTVPLAGWPGLPPQVFLGLRIDPSNSIVQLNRQRMSSPERGNDWDSLAILTRTPAGTTSIGLDAATAGSLGPNQRTTYTITVPEPGRLIARVHSDGPLVDLALQDQTGKLLVDSSGTSLTDPDDLIIQHVTAPVSYMLEISSAANRASYTFRTQFQPATQPFQALSVPFSTRLPVLEGDPRNVVTGDFNGDGTLDMAVVNPDTNNISIFLGLGDGTFEQCADCQVKAQPMLGKTPTAITAGDFDGDGVLDLAVVNSGDSTVSILLGNGDGSFRPAPGMPISVGRDPDAIVTGDFEGNGVLDLAVVDGGDKNVLILHGDGHGRFQPLRDAIPVGNRPDAIVAGDFRGDGILDLALANRADNTVTVLQGNGQGSFTSFASFGVANGPTSLVAGDFNGDGTLDLAVASEDTINICNVSLLLGTGNGSFRDRDKNGHLLRFDVQGRPYSIAAGDFRGNGRLDLATANIITNDVSVLLGNGDGTFQTEIELSAGLPPETALQTLVVGDFNGDGRVDMGFKSDDSFSVFAGSGDGSFQIPEPATEGGLQSQGRVATGLQPVDIATADFNNDGRPDLVVLSKGLNAATILLGEGDGTFQNVGNYSLGQDGTARSLIVGDFNGDGREDLAVSGLFASDTVLRTTLLLGLGDGTFRKAQGPQAPARSASAGKLAAGYFHRKGVLDLAITNGNQVLVYQNQGDGNFEPDTTPLTVGGPSEEVTSVVAGDFEGAGKLEDLAATESDLGTGSGTVRIFLNQGDGGFQNAGSYPVGVSPDAIATGHFRNLNHMDLAIANEGSGTVSVLLGLGGGRFLSAKDYMTGTMPVAVVTDDFFGHGNGVDDLAVLNRTIGNASVLHANGDGSFQIPIQSAAIGEEPSAMVANDFTNDGNADLVTGNTAEADLSVLLGQGNGTFIDPTRLATAGFQSNPIYDGASGDSVVVDRSGRVLLRQEIPNSGGEFGPLSIINSATDADGSLLHPARAAAIVDIGNQKRIAILDKNTNRVWFYPIQSTGTPVGAPLITGLRPVRILIAQFHTLPNGLEPDDLVVLNAGDGTISVFLSDGQGGYSAPHTISLGNGPVDIAVAPLTDSGLGDILVVNQISGDLGVLVNDGTGRDFTEHRYRAGQGPYDFNPGFPGVASRERTTSLTIGDFNHDGKTDMVVTNAGSNTFALLLGRGNGSFLNPLTFTLPFSPSVVATDRVQDNDAVIFLNQIGARLSVYLGNGKGGFQENPNANNHQVPIATGSLPTGLAVVDVNGDHLPDLQIASAFGDLLNLLGNRDGSFHTPINNKISLAGANSANGNTFVLANPALGRVNTGTLPTNGSGQLQQLQQLLGPLIAPGAVTLADLNNDNRLDAIVADTGGNRILVYFETQEGQFSTEPDRVFSVGTEPVAVTVGDLGMGNGALDLVVANKGSNDVSILLGKFDNGAWTAMPGPRLRAGEGPTSTLLEDLTGNGRPDILVSNSQSNNVSRLINVGNGFFNDATDPLPFLTGNGPVQILPLNTIMGPGFATINSGSNSISVFLDSTGALLDTLPSGGGEPSAAVVTDDLRDLIVANSDGEVELLLQQPDGTYSLERTGSGLQDPPTGLALPTVMPNGSFQVFLASDQADTSVFSLTYSPLVTSRPPTPPVPAAPAVSLHPMGLEVVAVLLIEIEPSSGAEAADHTALQQFGIQNGELAQARVFLAGGDEVGSPLDDGSPSPTAENLTTWLGGLSDSMHEFMQWLPSMPEEFSVPYSDSSLRGSEPLNLDMQSSERPLQEGRLPSQSEKMETPGVAEREPLRKDTKRKEEPPKMSLQRNRLPDRVGVGAMNARISVGEIGCIIALLGLWHPYNPAQQSSEVGRFRRDKSVRPKRTEREEHDC